MPGTFTGWRRIAAHVALRESECRIWAISPAGRRVDIGGLAPAGDSGNRADRCYVLQGLAASEVIGDRARASLVISNPTGHWKEATLFAVYVMPGEPGLSSKEAMRRMETDLGAVRLRALELDRIQGRGPRHPRTSHSRWRPGRGCSTVVPGGGYSSTKGRAVAFEPRGSRMSPG